MSQKHTRFRKLADAYSYLKPYGELPDDRLIFQRMAPMQVAALQALANKGLIDPAGLQRDEVEPCDVAATEELMGRVSSVNEDEAPLIEFLKVLGTEYNLSGVGGLKDRTGLLEYRHDAV